MKNLYQLIKQSGKQRFKKIIILSIIHLFGLISVFGQAPGGVSSNLYYWIKADAGVTGTNVSQWSNQASTSMTTQAGKTASSNVTLVSNSFNFNPVVRFDGATSQRLSGAFTTAPANSPLIFAVLKPRITSTSYTNPFSIGTGSYGMYYNSAGYLGADASGGNSQVLVNYQNTFVLKRIRYNAQSLTGNTQAAFSLTESPSAGSTAVAAPVTTFEVGGRTGGGQSSRIYTGDIAEIVYYNSNAASSTEIAQIESYLALKYGMTLDRTGLGGSYLNSSGTAVFTDSGTYWNNVFGIGYDTGSSLDQRVSNNVNSTTLVMATTADFTSANGGSRTALSSGQFLVAGSDTGTVAFGTTFNGTANSRLNRIWKVQNTGSVTNTYFAVPSSLSFPSGGTPVMIVSSDTTFTLADTVIPMTLGSGVSAGFYYAQQTIPTGYYITFAEIGKDYSDAPATYGTPSHDIVSGIYLGTNFPDFESAAQPGSSANLDDTTGTDDEDGVTISSLTQGQIVNLSVKVNGSGGYLEGWIDWNGNGTFDANENVAPNIQDNGTGDTNSSTGTINFPVYVPHYAVTGTTYARFRWSTTSGLSSTAAATDGEVEDYAVSVFTGNSSSPSGCPIIAHGAASGNSFSWTGTPSTVTVSTNTTWNTVNGGYSFSDENDYSRNLIYTNRWEKPGGNVTMTLTFSNPVPANEINLTINDVGSSSGGAYNPSINFSVTGGATTGDFVMNQLGSGTILAYIPATGAIRKQFLVETTREFGALVGKGTNMVSSISFTTSGFSVNDFVQYTLGTNLRCDFGDAPDAAGAGPAVGDYSTLRNSNGPISFFPQTPTTYLGAGVTSEQEALQNATATGDADNGVTIPTVISGQTATFTANVVGSGGYLQGWIDYNKNGVFTDPGEQIITNLQDNGTGDTNASSGTIAVAVPIPATAVGTNFARFRWSTTSDLTSVRAASESDPNGETEDYQLTILAPDLTIDKSHTGDFTGGSPGTYSLTIGNSGTLTTSGTITVTDTLPTGLTIADGAVTLGGANAADWTCNAASNVITCTHPTAIAVSGSSVFSFTVNVSITAPSSLTNTATVSDGGEPTANNGNNSDSDPTTVNAGPPNVSLVKSCPNPANCTSVPQLPGTDLTYQIVFTNTGGLAAADMIIVDGIPVNTDYKISSAAINAGTSGLTFTIEYSADYDPLNPTIASWIYTPISGGGGANTNYDRLVKAVRWRVTAGTLSNVSPNNTGDVSFVAKIR